MELFDQIRKVSFIFFLGLGLAHFLAGLFFINGYFTNISGLLNRILFIPFVVSALAYGLSNFKCSLIEYGKDSKAWNYVFVAFSIIIFLILLSVELFIPDSITPLKPPAI